jgi:hypothetical protein
MISRRTLLLAGLVAAACAAPAQRAHWDKPGAGSSDFAMANEHCGAAASRVKPQARPDLRQGGIVVPQNRPDRPPRPFVSAVAERAYMDCMADEGWRVVSR